MNKTILIVEDEEKIRDIIKTFFLVEGFKVLEAEDGLHALHQFESNHVDLVVLDIMIPHVDGWAVCKRIRMNSDIPIIILTARSDEEDKLLGFELGADEYVTKPFSPNVLVARSKAMLKRVNGDVLKNSTLSFGGIEIDNGSFTASVDGCGLTLAPKEFKLLLFLIENRGQVLSREQILSAIWGYDYYGGSRVVDSHIKKLRKKLGHKSDYIKTLVRVGYKFEVPDED